MDNDEPQIYDEDNHIDQFYIGAITFENIGICDVYVYGPDDCKIPHFHIFNKDHSFECYILIYDNNFCFQHKYINYNTLDFDQCKQLNEWLNEPNRLLYIAPMTNWEMIMTTWEICNRECKFPESKKIQIQPNYENMY